MNNEQVLLDGARHYDEGALTEIYDTYSPAIYRYAMRLLGDPDLAEECVAESFSRFLAALKQGRGPHDYLRAYLYRTAHNWVTDYYRRRPAPNIPLDFDISDDDHNQPPQIIAQKLAQEEVRTALAHLTPDQRMVIMLKFLEDWNNEEIAHALGKPVGAVKSLQHRAINALRRFFIQQTEERP